MKRKLQIAGLMILATLCLLTAISTAVAGLYVVVTPGIPTLPKLLGALLTLGLVNRLIWGFFVIVESPAFPQRDF